MDHAEAHERIADLALEPSRLASLGTSESVDDVALREHVITCSRCQSELADWRTLQKSVGNVLANSRPEQFEPIALPRDLRRQILQTAHAEPSQQAARTIDQPVVALPSRRSISRFGLVALAAVFALIAVGTGVVYVRDQSSRLAVSSVERRWLSDTVAAVNRILVAPEHHVVTLYTADGTAAGTLTWSQHDVAVLASTLPQPPEGQVYRCWLAYEGKETAMGTMWFVDGNSFWVGSTEDWAQIDLNPDKHFIVTLEPAAGQAGSHTGPVLLQANLAG